MNLSIVDSFFNHIYCNLHYYNYDDKLSLLSNKSVLPAPYVCRRCEPGPGPRGGNRGPQAAVRHLGRHRQRSESHGELRRDRPHSGITLTRARTCARTCTHIHAHTRTRASESAHEGESARSYTRTHVYALYAHVCTREHAPDRPPPPPPPPP